MIHRAEALRSSSASRVGSALGSATLLLGFAVVACGSSGGSSAQGGTAGSGASATGGSTSGSGGSNAGGSNGAGASSGGSATGGNAGAGGSAPLPRDPCVAAGTCPPGTWINVTPDGLDPSDLSPATNAFGPGAIVGDPARPSDLYVGGSASGLWKSTDYGNTWALVSHDVPNAPRGVTIAVAGTTPATIWGAGYNVILKSTDGGASFQSKDIGISLYSLKVDPNDPEHLISGLHEADGIVESIDGGATWNPVTGAGFPSGGVSWYPYFVDTGDAATTRTTWFAIAQNGASAIMTSDGGAHWDIPNGISGLQHPHGNSQIFQSGNSLFVGGTGGPGQGVYRSTDLGANWARVDSGQTPEAVVWGTPTHVYAMYAWACSNCDLGTDFEIAPLPGTTWTPTNVPTALNLGPNSVAVTSDGTHYVFVAVMWSLGIWRYVEP